MFFESNEELVDCQMLIVRICCDIIMAVCIFQHGQFLKGRELLKFLEALTASLCIHFWIF